MNKRIGVTLLLVMLIFSMMSCERDDICPLATPTTPLLIIEFFDVSEPEENKSVFGLGYIAGDSEVIIEVGTTDSIAIPLDTNANITKYQFIRSTSNETLFNSDTIEFFYQVDDVYINRSCGFRAVFSNLSGTRLAEDPLTDNWIRSVEIVQIIVENEQNTHVHIFH